MRIFKKLLALAFFAGLCLSQVAFAGGGQAFYPFAYTNPADLVQVKHLKISVGWFAAFVKNKFNGQLTLPGTTLGEGIARSHNWLNIPGG